MAHTICLHCDKAYPEQNESCSYCNKSVDQQLFFNKYTPKKYKIKILGKWLWKLIWY